MIYLLYGPDTYRSRQKLADIEREFRKKSGDASSVRRVDAAEDAQALYDIGRTDSLFVTKELAVIENVATADATGQTYVLGELPRWQSDASRTVIFREGDIDIGSTAVLKRIAESAAKTQAFSLLAPAAVSRWLEAEAQSRGLRLSPDERRVLVARFGADLWAMANELDKARDGWPVGTAAGREEKIWGFTDAFFRQRRSSVRPLAHLLAAGHEPIYLVGVLAGALRTVALIWSGLKQKNLKILTASIHPFVVKKHSEEMRRVSAVSIANAFDSLVDTDLALKTGRAPSPLPIVELVLQRPESKPPRS